MMSTKPKVKYVSRIFVVAIVLFAIILSFFGGFYFGIWQSVKQGYKLPIIDVIQDASGYFNQDKIDISLFGRIWTTIRTNHIDGPTNEEDIFYGALKGMVDSLNDPYSIFMDPNETSEFNQELSGSFEGIGAEIGRKDNQLTVISPLPNSPAAQAGLKAGDKILKIDNIDTLKMSLEKAVGLIRGDKDTWVTLTIFSENDQEVREIKIKRGTITVESVTWESLNENIAYVEIVHFNEDTNLEFSKIVNEIIIADPMGLVLDLRNNPGGFLNSAVDVAGEFIEEKLILIEDFGDEKEEYKSKGTAKLKNIKTVVLVNMGSASASEIVAGALQDYNQAIVVGEATYGKGSVQDFEEFGDGSSLKLTVAKWYTPNGRSIDDEGIVPDIEIELTDEDYENDLDPQLLKAIEILKGE